MYKHHTPNVSDVDTASTHHPIGRLRLLPLVVFGARAAALARGVLPVAMVTAGMAAGGDLTGAENLVTMDTSCCPLVDP
jgi:hypothetical protein